MTKNSLPHEKVLRIGIAGLGTVAQGLLTLLVENAERITRQAGMPIEVVRIASRSMKPKVDIGEALFDTALESLLHDDVDVVVELIGGSDAAHELISSALIRGKPIVTANKAVLAEYGNEWFNGNATVGIEAAVAGGIPIVSILKNGLSGNRIDWLVGIINGTCNYILTAMDEQGTSFASALAKAQELGYAEADPGFDVDGVDAAQKLALLAALAFDIPVSMDDMYIEGISGVTVEDLRYARELGFRIRHVGIARRNEEKFETRVHPSLIPATDLVGDVSGVANAVIVGANAIGSVLLVGPGAGGLPTASAVLSDLIEIARGTCQRLRTGQNEGIRTAITATESRYYLNIPAVDRPGVFGEIGDILRREGISIEAVIQKPEAMRRSDGEPGVPIVMVTERVVEASMDDALDQLSSLESVRGQIRRIRVADFDR
ncbi:MAG: homoserine dehydrogenase [Pseudomonadota bacterium]|nr:homoserine dehydrogenase [Pseudomonadota bacterium]MED5556363.1 homoserine dehydrogenase [Pseudomonadota bacterium]